MSEVERLLRGALVPIDPPGTMTERLERRLTALTDAAVGELAEFDPRALRDPRRWARLVMAGVVAGTAGGALVLVRARQKQRQRQARGVRALQKGMREVSGDVRKRFRR
ncbi:MAG: hypothetical protein QOK25_1291 [Thermoleophilaceae bacterium]|jgi:hypothetical protein|nr:hypothetical protein [Thermoleophilaceae bacterium]